VPKSNPPLTLAKERPAAPSEEIGGRYCENCHVGHIVPDDVTISAVSEGVREYTLDPSNAEALWRKSEELVGESFKQSDDVVAES
jgi:hypothetical protein